MSSHRHRKRSHSHEKSHHSSTHKSPKRAKNVATETTKHNEDVLQQILQSVTELKADLSVCNSRISALEAPSDASVFPSNEHDEDILSVSAGNDLDQYVPAHQENMATKPPDLAIKPPEMTIQSPHTAIGPPTTVPLQSLTFMRKTLNPPKQVMNSILFLYMTLITPTCHGHLQKYSPPFWKKISVENYHMTR